MEIFLIHLQWKFRDEEIGLKNELWWRDEEMQKWWFHNQEKWTQEQERIWYAYKLEWKKFKEYR
jgi:hypothetical protein